ncbi:PREDICTED: protein white-like [Priapulus caudatus]|uniref:tRNA-intron lyase n=1 Tax=Priapulus caudatus TaxID=37621 RepID=A0ABM1E0X8_PRICU|nr:PREDICTED: protein white-like [Priapulus caudatus]
MIPIFVRSGCSSALVFNAKDACTLREKHRIVGTFVGCLPRAPRQNSQLGLPMHLLPEEVTLLVELGIARLLNADPLLVGPTEEDKQFFQESRKESYVKQSANLLHERKAQLSKLADRITAGKIEKMKNPYHKKTRKEKKKQKLQLKTEGSHSMNIHTSIEDSCNVMKECMESEPYYNNSKTSTADNPIPNKNQGVTHVEDIDGDALSPEQYSVMKQKILEEMCQNLEPLRADQAMVQQWTESPRLATIKQLPIDWDFPCSPIEGLRYAVYSDIWHRGYYLTVGGKFGGDFLIYPDTFASCQGDIYTKCVGQLSGMHRQKLYRDEYGHGTTESEITETTPFVNPGSTRSSDGVSAYVNSHSNYKTVKRIRRQLSASDGLRSVLAWRDLNVYVKANEKDILGRTVGKATKQILYNVSGVIQPGCLLAVMGPSGCGKTTLLNALTCRDRQLVLDGDVTINGCNIGAAVAVMSGYVQQDDLFITRLTVKETLIFHAMLKMKTTLLRTEKLQRVEEVLLELVLTVQRYICWNQDLHAGYISITWFSFQILNNPPILFCDEPTSGLDSYMAENIVSVLGRLAATNRTIMCTIHQPSSQVFQMFDSVLFITEGRTAFLGSRKEALSFFHSQGYPCPSDYNPADFFIHNLSIRPGKEDGCKESTRYICNAFEASELNERIMNQISNAEFRGDNYSMAEVQDEFLAKSRRYKAGWCRQLSLLLWRSCSTHLRNKYRWIINICQRIMVAIVLGLLYLQIASTINQTSLSGITGLLFLIVVETCFSSMWGLMLSIPVETPIFFREYKNGMYGAAPYFISKVASNAITLIVEPLTFVSILYWMSGLYASWDAYFTALGVCVLASFVSGMFGFLFSAISSNITALTTMMGLVNVTLLLFSGLFVQMTTFPKAVSWVQEVSWFRLASEALLINQWTRIDYIECEYESLPCKQNGLDVLEQYSFKPTQSSDALKSIGITYPP